MLRASQVSGSYWRRRTTEDNRISWTGSSEEILNTIRATAPNYQAYAYKQDGTKVTFSNYIASDTPGKVLIVTADGCLISTRSGVVWLSSEEKITVGEVLT